MLNPILTAANATLKLTNLAATPNGTTSLTGLPLGTPGDSPTGALGLKIVSVGGVAPTGSATNAGAPNMAMGSATATGGATGFSLAAARATRRNITIDNTHATLTLKFGPLNTTASAGKSLPPQSSIVLATTSAIFIWETTGAATAEYVEVYD